MATEERLEQLERSLQQAGTALQAANYRIASLESAAGTTITAASMVDMRELGKPSIFAQGEASWKSWSFVMLSFSAAVSPELRALMEKAQTHVVDMLNVNLTAAEQVWSRQLYYMLSLSTSGEAQRRLQNVPDGDCAEAWKVFSEHYDPKQPRGMSECSGRFSCMTSGSSHSSSIGSNSSDTLSGSTRNRAGSP